MIRVQHEDPIHGARDHGVDLVVVVLGERRVEKILGVVQVIPGRQIAPALAMPVGQRGERRHFRDQALRGCHSIRLVGDVEPFVVFGGERTGECRHDPHGMGAGGELSYHGLHATGNRAFGHHHRVERGLVGCRGKAAVQQEVAQFKKVGLLGELLDGVAAVQKGAGVAVDIGDVGVAGCRRDEPGVVGEIAFAGQLADVDDVLAEARLEDGEFDGIIDAIDIQAGVPRLSGRALVAADRTPCRALRCICHSTTSHSPPMSV